MSASRPADSPPREPPPGEHGAALVVFDAGGTVIMANGAAERLLDAAPGSLLGTIGGGLAAALRDEPHREAALITFLVTLSGVTVAGIGSAFWGVVAGGVALAAQRVGRAKAPTGKDIAPACKIRLDDRAGATSAGAPAGPSGAVSPLEYLPTSSPAASTCPAIASTILLRLGVAPGSPTPA